MSQGWLHDDGIRDTTPGVSVVLNANEEEPVSRDTVQLDRELESPYHYNQSIHMQDIHSPTGVD